MISTLRRRLVGEEARSMLKGLRDYVQYLQDKMANHADAITILNQDHITINNRVVAMSQDFEIVVDELKALKLRVYQLEKEVQSETES